MNEEIEEEETNELFEHHNLIIEKGQEAVRIDKYLMDRIANTTRNKIQESAK